jgi:small subunit ribosomal protein S8
VLTILNKKGYIGQFEEVLDGKNNILKMNLLGNINKIGVIKPRFSVTNKDYVEVEKRFLPAKNFGVIILSTSKGIMTFEDAQKQKIGGKLLCYCY